MKLVKSSVALMSLVVLSTNVQALDLPKEVTPAIRSACEKDVRRLCIRRGSTMSSVKACVIRKFKKLNARCQMRLVRAGF